MKKKIKKIVISILVLFITLTTILQIILMISPLGLSVIDVYTLPIVKKDKVVETNKEKFLIKNNSYFEYQGLNQCSAYSTSYLLRSRNIEVSGADTYLKLDHKFANGYVLPQAITKELKRNGIKTKIYTGSLAQLKMRLIEGTPIIVLIGDGIKWQHYVTVVGYDQNNIFLYDSLSTQNLSKSYNRKISNQEFLNQWDNKLPFYNKIYYVSE